VGRGRAPPNRFPFACAPVTVVYEYLEKADDWFPGNLKEMRQIAAFLVLTSGILLAREYGPAPGEKLPAFSLPDQDGKVRSLQSLLGPKGALVLFYRSADWCPFCKAQLLELEQSQAEFKKLGLGVTAISYDSVAILHDFAQRRGIHFALLSDAGSTVIKKAGLLNETLSPDHQFFGIPYPGMFVLDAKGVITAKYFEDDYQERYTSSNILVHQFGLQAAASRSELENKQLQLSYAASNSSIHAGQRVALELDIELKPKMHVYAPGVQSSYIPIEWTITDSALANAHEVTLPKPEMLNLEAIGETVPVFTGKLRLTRDITLADDAKLKGAVDADGYFVVEGVLRYQACDDHICYIPKDVPLKWKFHYEASDRERSPAGIQHKPR
jgi:peroxiredoxin